MHTKFDIQIKLADRWVDAEREIIYLASEIYEALKHYGKDLAKDNESTWTLEDVQTIWRRAFKHNLNLVKKATLDKRIDDLLISQGQDIQPIKLFCKYPWSDGAEIGIVDEWDHLFGCAVDEIGTISEVRTYIAGKLAPYLFDSLNLNEIRIKFYN